VAVGTGEATEELGGALGVAEGCRVLGLAVGWWLGLGLGLALVGEETWTAATGA